MGKKEKIAKADLQASLLHGKRTIENFKLVRNARTLRQFLWKETRLCNISARTQGLCNEVIDAITGSQRLDSEFDSLIKRSEESYCWTHRIFQIGSLKDRYQNILLKETLEGGGGYQPKKLRELVGEEVEWLERVRKIYKKYRVSSIYYKNLLKEGREAWIDKLVDKGYLKQIKEGILTLVA